MGVTLRKPPPDIEGKEVPSSLMRSPSAKFKAGAERARHGARGFTKFGVSWIDAVFLRIADGVTIATFGGVSMQWHKRHRGSQRCCSDSNLWIALVLLCTAAAIAVPVHGWLADGLSDVVDYANRDLQTTLRPEGPDTIRFVRPVTPGSSDSGGFSPYLTAGVSMEDDIPNPPPPPARAISVLIESRVYNVADHAKDSFLQVIVFWFVGWLITFLRGVYAQRKRTLNPYAEAYNFACGVDEQALDVDDESSRNSLSVLEASSNTKSVIFGEDTKFDSTAEAAGVGGCVRSCGREWSVRWLSIVGSFGWLFRTALVVSQLVLAVAMVVYCAFLVGSTAHLRSAAVTVDNGVKQPEPHFILSNAGLLGSFHQTMGFNVTLSDVLQHAALNPLAPLDTPSRRLLGAIAVILNVTDPDSDGRYNPPHRALTQVPPSQQERVATLAEAIVILAEATDAVERFHGVLEQVEGQCQTSALVSDLMSCAVPQAVSWLISAPPSWLRDHESRHNSSSGASTSSSGASADAPEGASPGDQLSSARSSWPRHLAQMGEVLREVARSAGTVCGGFVRVMESLEPLFASLAGVRSCLERTTSEASRLECASELAEEVREAQQRDPMQRELDDMVDVFRRMLYPSLLVVRELLVRVLRSWPWNPTNPSISMPHVRVPPLPPAPPAPPLPPWASPVLSALAAPPPSLALPPLGYLVPPAPPRLSSLPRDGHFNVWLTVYAVLDGDSDASLYEVEELIGDFRQLTDDLYGAAVLLLLMSLLFLTAVFMVGRTWDAYAHAVYRRAIMLDSSLPTLPTTGYASTSSTSPSLVKREASTTDVGVHLGFGIDIDEPSQSTPKKIQIESHAVQVVRERERMSLGI